MNDFRILNEETFKFKNGKLYLMLLRDDGRFGMEIVDKTKTFGRKYTNTKTDAEDIFNTLSKRLDNFSSLKDAEDYLTKCFSIKTLDKFRLVIMALDNLITQEDIVSLRKKIKFRTKVKLNYNKKEKQEDSLTIYLYSNRNMKSPFGVLVGDMTGKNLKFEIIKK